MDISWYNIDEYFHTILAPDTLRFPYCGFDGVYSQVILFSRIPSDEAIWVSFSVNNAMSKTIKNISKIFKQFPKEWYVCPGHGDIVTLEKLFRINPFLNNTVK